MYTWFNHHSISLGDYGQDGAESALEIRALSFSRRKR